MRRLSAPVLFVCLLLATGAWADEPPGPQDPKAGAQPVPIQDFLPLVLSLEQEMKRHGEPPEVDGPGRELYGGWKRHLKSRSRTLAAEAARLARSAMWTFDQGGGAAVHLAPSQWGVAVRHLTKIYTGLGAALKGHGQIRVSAHRAIALWHRKHPEPRLTGLTHSGVLLRHVRAEIAALKAMHKIVPHWLVAKLNHLITAEQIEIDQRREAHRMWQAERAAAMDVIHARVEATKALVAEKQGLLSSQMQSVRSLMGAMQQIEERRLRALVAAFPPQDEIHALTTEWFVKMARGRDEAERFNDARTSRWGSLLRRQWTAVRKRVLTAIEKAEARRDEAGAPVVPNGAPDAPGDGG